MDKNTLAAVKKFSTGICLFTIPFLMLDYKALRKRDRKRAHCAIQVLAE